MIFISTSEIQCTADDNAYIYDADCIVFRNENLSLSFNIHGLNIKHKFD